MKSPSRAKSAPEVPIKHPPADAQVVQATATPSADSATTANVSSLGDLDNLPPDIRHLIFGYTMPKTFHQTFDFKGDHSTGVRLRHCSPSLGILYASPDIRYEAARALLSNTHCTIRIDSDSFTTSFPLVETVLYQQTSPVSLLVGKDLTVTVEIPNPRMAKRFAKLRRNVTQVVDLINERGDARLPPIHATLHSEQHLALAYTHNDYAMLLGPLARLAHVSRGCTLSCSSSPRTRGPDEAKCVQQCRLIEAAAGTGGDEKHILLRQQLLIDIKLELALYQGTRRHLGAVRGERIVRALTEYKEVLAGAGDAGEWKWVKALHRKLVGRDGAVGVRVDLLKKVFEGHDVCEFLRWASGHQTGRNPFWN